MKKWLKKFVSLMLASSLCAGGINSAFADEENVNRENSIMENDSKIENDGSKTSEGNKDEEQAGVLEDSEEKSENDPTLKEEENETENSNEMIDIEKHSDVTSEEADGESKKVENEETANEGTPTRSELSSGKFDYNSNTTWTIYSDNTATISGGEMPFRPMASGIPIENQMYDKIIKFDGILTVDDSVIFPENSNNLFRGYKAEKLIINNNTNNVTEMDHMFYQCEFNGLELGANFNTENVTEMGWMFSDNKNLKTLDLSKANFDTRNVEMMLNMFSLMTSLEELDFGSLFDTSSVKNMYGMFRQTGNHLKLNLSSFTINGEMSDYADSYVNTMIIFSESGIDELILGENVKKLQTSWLPEADELDGYKEGWTRLDDEECYETTEDFLEDFNKNKIPGTYVRGLTEKKALAIKANDFTISLSEVSKLIDKDVVTKSDAKVYEETLRCGKVVDSKLLENVEININADDLEKIKSTKEAGVFKVKLTTTNEIGTAEKEIKVTVENETSPGEIKILVIKANDFKINLSEVSKLTNKDVIEKSEAKVYEEIFEAGEVGDSKLLENVEIKVNADDLEKIRSTKEAGVFKVKLTATNELGTAEKEIEVTVEGEPVTIEEKFVEIEASDFSTSIRELEKTKSLEKLILEKSKAKAFYVEKNSLGEETKRKQIDVKINADDLEKLKTTKKVGDYKIRLSAEEEDVNNNTTITVTVIEPSEKPSKETPKDKDKEKPLKDKTNKKSKNNSKTGVAGIAGVAAVLAGASGLYVSSKKKK